MQFDMTDSGALRVLLSDGELGRMGLTFANLDGASPLTHSALKTVLLSAEAQAGFDISAPMCIEAIPVEGGCLLLFTPEHRDTTRFWRRAGAPAAVWRFDGADALLSFGQALTPLTAWIKRRASLCAASLYGAGETYWLILHAPSLLPRGLLPILSEFSERVGGQAAAMHVAEHQSAICLRDALLRLTGLESLVPTPRDRPH